MSLIHSLRLVECSPEQAGVGSSTPSLATNPIRCNHLRSVVNPSHLEATRESLIVDVHNLLHLLRLANGRVPQKGLASVFFSIPN